MALKKCPRCELNYVREGEKYCDVCKRYRKGEPEAEEAVPLCSECGERPAIRGNDLCAICLREARRQNNLSKLPQDDELPTSMDLDEVDMDDMEVPLGGDDEIPERELEEIDRELGGDMDEEEEEDSFSEED